MNQPNNIQPSNQNNVNINQQQVTFNQSNQVQQNQQNNVVSQNQTNKVIVQNLQQTQNVSDQYQFIPSVKN